jgi:RimJ/RimL family protein N-acetyltransferase
MSANAAPPIDAPENRLSDGVIVLAPIELVYVRTIIEWDADREIQHWFDWPLTPAADERETYATRLASAERAAAIKQERWGKGEQFAFVIQSASGDGLGWIELQPRGSGRGSISYGVLERHRGKGAATRSVLLVTRYAFDVLGWARVEIEAIADNAGSRAVATKAGFRQEGLLHSYGAFEKYQPELGRRFDWVIYGRLCTDAEITVSAMSSVQSVNHS